MRCYLIILAGRRKTNTDRDQILIYYVSIKILYYTAFLPALNSNQIFLINSEEYILAFPGPV